MQRGRLSPPVFVPFPSRSAKDCSSSPLQAAAPASRKPPLASSSPAPSAYPSPPLASDSPRHSSYSLSSWPTFTQHRNSFVFQKEELAQVNRKKNFQVKVQSNTRLYLSLSLSLFLFSFFSFSNLPLKARHEKGSCDDPGKEEPAVSL